MPPGPARPATDETTCETVTLPGSNSNVMHRVNGYDETAARSSMFTLNSVSARTSTVKVHGVVLPHGSMAVYVTVVVPIGNVSPELYVEVKLATEQLSLAVGGVQVTAAEQ